MVTFFFLIEVGKWLLRFLGPHSSHPLPKVSRWVEDISNHRTCRQNFSTPLSETTNLSCYHWGFRKDACSGWRMTGQLNIIFRGHGERSTHEEEKFSARGTYGDSLWKGLFVIWKNTDTFLMDKYTFITSTSKKNYFIVETNTLWTFHNLRFTNHIQQT